MKSLTKQIITMLRGYNFSKDEMRLLGSRLGMAIRNNSFRSVADKYHISSSDAVRSLEIKLKELFDSNPNNEFYSFLENETKPVLENNPYIEISKFRQVFRSNKIDIGTIYPNNLSSLLEFFGITVSHQIITVSSTDIYVDENYDLIVRAISKAANKLASKYGAFSLEMLKEESNVACDDKVVLEIVKLFNFIVPLNESKTWLGGILNIHSSKNRFHTILRKMFSVTESIKMEDIYTAIIRSCRKARVEYIFIPEDELLTYIGLHEEYIVASKDDITCSVKFNKKKELSDLEKKVLSVYNRSHKKTLKRSYLIEQCMKLGMSKGSTECYLSWVPFLVPGKETQMWNLIGS